MPKKNDKKKSGLISVNKTVGENRRAKFDYHLEDAFEAGIVLTGSEVKSLRHGQCSIAESYIGFYEGELYIYNANIPEYKGAAGDQHETQRTRKLLLKKRELNRLIGLVQREGYTLVPLRLFFNGRGLAKIAFALGKGKKLHDKRETSKKRDWNRDKQRIMRDKG